MNTTPYANSVFEQPWWLDVVAPGQWGEVFVRENDQVIARMPYVLVKNKICMPPMTQTLGPWIHEKYRQYQPGNTQLSRQKEIIGALLSQLPKHSSVQMTLDSTNDYILPYRWQGFRYEPSFSYRITDLSNLDAVYANFNKTAKKNIRHSGHTVKVYSDCNTEILFDMVQKTFQHQSRKFPQSKIDMIERIVDRCEKEHTGQMFYAADKDGHVHAASYMVYDDKIAYALVGGADPAYRNSGAKSLIWWSEIQYAAKNSAEFDFEGSNIEGIENFVRQFGGIRVTNYSIYKQTLAEDMLHLLKPRIKRLIGYKV